MRDSLRNKISNYEEIPPPAVWNKINRQLEEEFFSADSVLSEKLEALTAEPPASAWENIRRQIHPGYAETERSGKVIPIVYKRIAVAVVIAASLSFGAMYFFMGTKIDNLTADTKAFQVSPTPKAQQNDTFSASPQRSPDNVNGQREEESSVIPPRSKSTPTLRKREINRSSQRPEISFVNVISEAHISPPDLQPVSDSEPISVTAPPIRDKHGNIILDLDLIAKPGQQYITVTSPNGNQTRISNKFLSCLSYINSSFASGEMDENAQDCKQRFEEWRERLLSDGSFIPAADNFFDIFQMKEMIQE